MLKSKTKDKILSKTSGIWKYRKIDGLHYVRKLRDEWKKITSRESFSIFRNIQSDGKQRQ